MKRISNRQRILDVARQLFNTSGTSKVSTNHIADAANVSPGNLYYHFKNKEEIITELYEEEAELFGRQWAMVRPGRTLIIKLVDLFYEGFEITYEYRFLARELSSLIQHNPALKEKHRQNYAQRFQLVKPLYDAAQAQGMVIFPGGDQLVDDQNHLIWLVYQFWQSYIDLESDDAPREKLQEGARMCLRVLEPYLREDIRKEAFDYLDDLIGTRK